MMPDRFDPTALRLGNLFAPSPYNPDGSTINQDAMAGQPQLQNQISQQQINQTPQNVYDVASRMAQLYRPQNTMTQAYQQQLQNMPNRANYQPSNMQKVAAALASLGTGGPTGHWGGQPVGYQNNPMASQQVGQEILNRPYNQAMGDWQNKTGAQGVAAQLEQQGNKGQLGVAENTIKNELTEQSRVTAEERNKIATDKSNQINELAWAKYQKDYDIAMQKLDEVKTKAANDQSNKDNLYQLALAKLEVTKAQNELEHARKTALLENTIKRTNEEIDNWHKSQEYKDKVLNRDSSSVTHIVPERDAQGNITGVTRTTQKGGQQASNQKPQRPIPGIEGGIAEQQPDGSWIRIK